MKNRKERCLSRKLDPKELPKIAIPIENNNLSKSYIKFIMKNLENDLICGYQQRYINPEYQQLKSRTAKGTHVGWYYEDIDISKPIIIAEGEVDFTTAYQLGWNVIGIQGVNNLNKTIKILNKKGAKKIIILVDNDDAAELAIKKVEDRINVYDGRYVLGNVKDINDAHLAGILKEPLALPSQNLFVKYGKFEIKKSTRPLPDKSIDFLSIDTAMVLQNLFPQYVVRGDRIYENGKILDGYRYWRNKNAVVDFSGKDRPQGNARSVAYSYYNNKKETAEYLKRYL